MGTQWNIARQLRHSVSPLRDWLVLEKEKNLVVTESAQNIQREQRGRILCFQCTIFDSVIVVPLFLVIEIK